ncbi:hypothetical protein DPSP01_006573 [Paraphaeosphaeria sporulosa]|uniref:DH domain-containing protein n=1 Tax=Paraphaeosphaeria sporulosa TaxID=1460663 RepID=A0A177CNP4_9PLEO|nr:uncharacterized protein CC84DRAFT_1162474 [Paraphaeosphaeria sporulosa]OAG08538.1 hypothetical protein CC84DRAFT_1162474 [Paraphaeosphaeria sporulosa]
MVTITPEPAALSASDLSLFYTTDELLSNSPVLVFYGPTSTSTQATHSRIQAHVFTPAGLQNFARLIISPTAPYYQAVACLPREEQGDEICRGLAFSLYKYFVELPQDVKNAWERQYASATRLPSAPTLFSESHAAIVAARMVRVENAADVIVDVRHALGEQTLPWLDLDVVLPHGSIKQLDNARESAQFDESEDDVLQHRYGSYAPVVKLLGEAAFIPTSRLRRAPSKPTALNKSQAFSRNQKENLRREMCELLDTEENYVSKVYELVNTVAVEFRQKAKQKSSSSTSPNEQALKALFPPSLDAILDVNAQFLDVIRTVLEDTENDAIQDIEQATDDIFVAPLRGQKDPADVTGALAVAKALVEWFPRFGNCYSDYMAAHADFSQLLKGFTKDINSSFSKRVYETGEQRLMSMLIEPVQRLPRYNLYIDNIIKQLPMRHPAIKVFLKARDIISEICSREGPSVQQIKILDRLRKMVFSWPATCVPQTRLITAIDFVELSPPYHGELHGPSTTAGIFLLFADSLIMLHKPNGCPTTARSLMADLDDPKFTVADVGSSELIFHQQLKLSDVFLSEHSEGNIMQMISPTPTVSQPGRPRSRDRQVLGIRMFYLLGIYEGKAQKCVEEITKARVEGRFPETERESHMWEVRSLTGDLNMFSAVTEDRAGQDVEGRREPAKVQVIVNMADAAQPVQPVKHSAVELTVSISIQGNEFYQLEFNGNNGYSARDKLTSVEFLPVLTKRLGNFFQSRNNIKYPALAEAYLFRNRQILKSLKLQLGEITEAHDEKGRPHSPVKMLSSLFGSSVREGGPKKLQRNPVSMGDIPKIAPPPLHPTRTHSRDGELSRPTSSNKTIGFNSNASPTDSLAKLEETLATLILALHARKGNIVGRSVRARVVADELLVNELYNSLLENPSNLDVPSQSSVDVLFAAFEKFLNIAWKEKMGPVLAHATLVSLQMKSDSMYPGEFEDFFRTTYSELSPQNQRALRAIIKLLAELLDGMGNDGDRGILTAAFAEILVAEGSANDFISLVDRFIQDIGVLFPEQQSGYNTPNFGSMDSRTRSAATGSLTSNTSLRKRFGFATLTRQDSKNEKESTVGSLWRSLSKNSHGLDGQSSSASKIGPASLGRSNSTDAAMRLSPKRPSSRDRPTVLGAFPFEGGNVSPAGRGFLGALGTIGEREVPSNAGPPRKKRRSSLSDLKTLQDANDAPTWSSQTPRGPDSPQREPRQASEEPLSPRTPSRSPAKPSSIPAPARLGSPVARLGSPIPPMPPRLGSPMRRENTPVNGRERAGSLRPVSQDEVVTIKTFRPTKKRGESVSAIPTLKPAAGLSERPTSGNTVKVPSTPRSPTKTGIPMSPSKTSPTKKLKMQSPQKLRERLQIQQRDIESASRDLQSELSAIGHELTARTPRLTAQFPPGLHDAPSTKALERRIAALEVSVKTTLDTLSTRTSTIAQDVSTSLEVSERRAKHLDKLYRDSNAENEALYARFNEELEKVEKSVRRGKGGEEVDRRLKASEEETARLRKENARLKREVAGLKAQIKE